MCLSVLMTPFHCVTSTFVVNKRIIYLQGIFIAYGPAFKKNITIDGFENIEVYNLLAG